MEALFPVFDPTIAKNIISILEIQWNDNVKANFFDASQSNSYKTNDDEIAMRSQIGHTISSKARESKLITNIENLKNDLCHFSHRRKVLQHHKIFTDLFFWYALIKYRVFVEIEYLKKLAELSLPSLTLSEDEILLIRPNQPRH